MSAQAPGQATHEARLARRIAELEAENARLRAELERHRNETRRKQKKSAYAGRRAALIAQGRWHPYVPAGPVRDHVRRVMTLTGMSRAQFAAAATINEGTVSKILYGSHARVTRPVAARIMQVTEDTSVPDLGWVSPAGASRRLQALSRAGWPVLLLAGRLETDESVVRKIRDGDRQRIHTRTARRISALYDQLWNITPPQQSRAEKIAVSKTRSFAARHGWPLPGAWDDDQIDKPDGHPAEGWERAPEPKYRKRAELAAEAEELSGFGVDRDSAARRLHVSRAALDRALSRTARVRREAAVSGRADRGPEAAA